MKYSPSSIWILILLGALCAGACIRKREAGRIVINVAGDGIHAARDSAAAGYVNGYRKTLGGQALPYRSSHPDADSALLVRANAEAGSIEWETDPLPSGAEGEPYRLIWLAGLERGGWGGTTPHTFDLYVGGERWLTFQNRKDPSAARWSVAGGQGAELSFEATTVDAAGDLFGTMVLKVPRRLVRPGAPLRLEVRGEDAGSRDWYMTFQYPFRPGPRLRAEPALTKEGRQLVRLSLDNLREGRVMEVAAEGMEPVRRPLAIGANIVYLEVPAVDRARELAVSWKIEGEPAQETALTLKPVSHRDVYLLSYSHNDIGYTDLQPVIEKKQWDNLDEALRLIEKTRSYPPDARYKWNLEVMWPLEGYLARASEAKRAEVVRAAREGNLGLNALYANILTGLASAPEMAHFTDDARRFSEQSGVPVTTALVSDIPGFSWGIVPALARGGVKYFASAPNSGDRIGHVLREWGDRPFYWASQSGEERVLMWVAGASYSSFHQGNLSKLGDEKVLALMRNLEESGYPYGIVQLPYTIGGDNGPPDANLPDFVRKWNDRYASPRLIIATHARMFAEFERRYGAGLPVLKGDFTPYWEDGAASTAKETALNRQAVDRLVQGEALWAMRAPGSYPEGDYDAAWRNVLLYDEHTWGAHNSVSEPDLPAVREQWEIKRRFALDADAISRALLERAGAAGPPGLPEDALAVFNTNSWTRTDLVLLSAEQSAAGDLVVDEGGKTVSSQRLSTGELAVLVEELPPFASRRLFVRAGPAQTRGECRAAGTTLENSLLSVTVDPKSGAIQSLTWGEGRLELADRASGAGLNQYLYVPGTDPGSAIPPSNVRVSIKESGGLVASLLVEAEAPGCREYAAEYRIIAGIARVDMVDRLDKLPVRTKESVHIAFPFHLPDGQLRYDVADGIVRPESDQLPGSCKNFFSLQSWVDISNRDHGVTWTSADAPLIEIGSITAERPWAQTTRSSPVVYSYLMNNYWHTNYKADQEGRATFRFSIVPHGPYEADAAVRRGREAREPLLVLPSRAASPPSRPSLFRVSPPAVLVSSLKPLAGGSAWLVGLYNPTDTAQHAVLELGAVRGRQHAPDREHGPPRSEDQRRADSPRVGDRLRARGENGPGVSPIAGRLRRKCDHRHLVRGDARRLNGRACGAGPKHAGARGSIACAGGGGRGGPGTGPPCPWA